MYNPAGTEDSKKRIEPDFDGSGKHGSGNGDTPGQERHHDEHPQRRREYISTTTNSRHKVHYTRLIHLFQTKQLAVKKI